MVVLLSPVLSIRVPELCPVFDEYSHLSTKDMALAWPVTLCGTWQGLSYIRFFYVQREGKDGSGHRV